MFFYNLYTMSGSNFIPREMSQCLSISECITYDAQLHACLWSIVTLKREQSVLSHQIVLIVTVFFHHLHYPYQLGHQEFVYTVAASEQIKQIVLTLLSNVIGVRVLLGLLDNEFLQRCGKRLFHVKPQIKVHRPPIWGSHLKPKSTPVLHTCDPSCIKQSHQPELRSKNYLFLHFFPVQAGHPVQFRRYCIYFIRENKVV